MKERIVMLGLILVIFSFLLLILWLRERKNVSEEPKLVIYGRRNETTKQVMTLEAPLDTEFEGIEDYEFVSHSPEDYEMWGKVRWTDGILRLPKFDGDK